MVFELVPFSGVDLFKFDVSRSYVYSVIGEPDRKVKKAGRKYVHEAWFKMGVHLYFDGEDLKEVNIQPPIVEANEVPSVKFVFLNYDIFSMPPEYIYSELCMLDGSPVEKVGSTILPHLGVGLYGFDNFSSDEQDERSFALYGRDVVQQLINDTNFNK
jgi:hypothetical protein